MPNIDPRYQRKPKESSKIPVYTKPAEKDTPILEYLKQKKFGGKPK